MRPVGLGKVLHTYSLSLPGNCHAQADHLQTSLSSMNLNNVRTQWVSNILAYPQEI
jgi:hypothetical protein